MRKKYERDNHKESEVAGKSNSAPTKQRDQEIPTNSVMAMPTGSIKQGGEGENSSKLSWSSFVHDNNLRESVTEPTVLKEEVCLAEAVVEILSISQDPCEGGGISSQEPDLPGHVMVPNAAPNTVQGDLNTMTVDKTADTRDSKQNSAGMVWENTVGYGEIPKMNPNTILVHDRDGCFWMDKDK